MKKNKIDSVIDNMQSGNELDLSIDIINIYFSFILKFLSIILIVPFLINMFRG